MSSGIGSMFANMDRRLQRLLIAAGVLAVCNLALLIIFLPDWWPAPAPTEVPTPAPTEAAIELAANPHKKPLAPGLYSFENGSHLAGEYTDPQLTGSQLEIMWDQVNGSGEGIYDWSVIDDWVAVEKSHGNKWILRVLPYQNRAAYGIPQWVENRMSPPYWIYSSDTFPDGLKLPNYGDPALWKALRRFTHDLGARYDSDPDLVLVQIGLGLYGEMHPERNDEFGNLKDWYYATDPVFGRRLPPCDWIQFITETVTSYADAFPSTSLVIMQAPSYGYKCDIWKPGPPATHEQYWERETVEDLCIELGVGFQNNSLDEWDANWFTCDVAGGTTGPYTVHGSLQSAVDNWRDIPVVFERGSWLAPYNKFFDKGYFQTWWSYLNALDKHADIIFPPNWGGEIWANGHIYTYPSGVWNYDGNEPDIPYAQDLRWMNQFAMDHLGRDESNTPSVWTVLFDTPTDNCTAQHRDHQFFLYRMEQTSDGEPIPHAGTLFEQDVYTAPPFYEGKYVRRTDQANDQFLMYFDIDDAYHHAADPQDSVWTVTLWYLNNGDDLILFEYRDVHGQVRSRMIRKPGGKTAGWLRTTFALRDAYFANNMGYGADFRISSAKDGPDEYIHMVQLTHTLRDGVIPTDTPTADPHATETATPAFAPATLPAPTATPTATPTEPAPGTPVEVIFQQGSNNYTGVNDTYISGWEPDGNFGDSTNMAVRTDDWMASLIRFEMAGISRQARIGKATLRLFVASQSNPNSLSVSAHMVVREWDADSATWVLAAQDESWTVPGALNKGLDIRNLPAASGDMATAGAWYEFDITPMVQFWVAHPEENQGLILRGSGAVGVQYNITSSDSTSADKRPALAIQYILPTYTPSPTWTNTPTPTDTSTHTPTYTPTETGTPTGTPTVTATHTVTPSPTASSTASPTSTHTPSPAETSTQTSTPTETASPTGTTTQTGTPSPTRTNTPKPTATSTDAPSATSSPTHTSTETASPTGTASPTNTPIPTGTFTDAPTATASATATGTRTRTSTPAPTQTRSPTLTHTPAPTQTSTPTATTASTATPESAATATRTASSTRTATSVGTRASTPAPTQTPAVTVSRTPMTSPTHTPYPVVIVTRTPVLNLATSTPTPSDPTRTPVIPSTSTPAPGLVGESSSTVVPPAAVGSLPAICAPCAPIFPVLALLIGAGAILLRSPGRRDRQSRMRPLSTVWSREEQDETDKK